MPSPQQIAAAAAAAARLQALAHGERTAAARREAAALGISVQTLYAWMRPHTGQRRAQRRDSLSRLVAQAAVLERRAQRGEALSTDERAELARLDAAIDARAGLSRAEADLIAAVLTESGRANGKRLMAIGHAVRTLRTQGLILAGSVDQETGEFVALSESAISRGLRRYGLHPTQLAAPTPHQPVRTLHPNARWEIDASLCVVYYLPTGAYVCDIDPARHYKNKPHEIEAIRTERVIRYVVTDHCSGVVRWRYYPGAESTAHTLDMLCWAVAPKADRSRDPFHGAPLRLVADPGATAASGVRRWCDLLGIELAPTKAKNPRAKGSVERGNGLVEVEFESGLRFQRQRIGDFVALNEIAQRYQLWWNATEPHSRHGLPRFAAWAKITPEQLRITEPEAVLRALATDAPARPKVQGDLTVQYRGQTWDVRGVAAAQIGQPIEVHWRPLLAPGAERGQAVAVLVDPATGRPLYQPLPLVARDDWGFRVDAPVDGEGFASMPATDVDRARKRLALLASGEPSQEADELARRRRDFRPLAHLDEGRGLDPYRAAETAEPVTWLPRRGTEHRPARPDLAPVLLAVDEAALRLAGLVRAAGGTWGPDQYTWLAARHPDGVPEAALAAIAAEITDSRGTGAPAAAGHGPRHLRAV